MTRRVAFICCGLALMLGVIGAAAGRSSSSSEKSTPRAARVVPPGLAKQGLPMPGLAKKWAGSPRKALPFGLSKRGPDKALPPGWLKGKANHGQCVSRWAHEATEEGLSGRDHARFVSSVAEDHGAVGSDCDKQAALEAALQAAAD